MTLVLAPHLDDAQLGAGATIHKLSQRGDEIWVCTLSDTGNIYGDEHAMALRQENKRSLDILGVPENRTITATFPTRNFDKKRQEILDFLIELRNEIKPTLILTTSTEDIHQDHGVLGVEVRRAFRGKTVFGFDTYWNMSTQDTKCVVEITSKNLEAKILSLQQFDSQSNRAYVQPINVEALARVRGLPSGFELAEAFSIQQLAWPSLGKDDFHDRI